MNFKVDTYIFKGLWGSINTFMVDIKHVYWIDCQWTKGIWTKSTKTKANWTKLFLPRCFFCVQELVDFNFLVFITYVTCVMDVFFSG